MLSRASELLPELRDIFAFTLEAAVANQLSDEPDLATEARNIVLYEDNGTNAASGTARESDSGEKDTGDKDAE